MSNAVLRVLTALVAAPIVVALAYWGGWAFGVLVAGIALIGQAELYAMAEAGGLQPHKPLGLAVGGLLVLQPVWPAAGSLALLAGIGVLVLVPWIFEREQLLPSFAATLLGAFYPTLLLSFLLRLRGVRGPTVGSEEAFALVLLTLLLVWASDIFAYYVGRAVGRRPLAPTVSPHKTWEGAIGGVGASVVVAVGFKGVALPFLAWPHLLALAVICGGVGQLGDLAESQLKRAVQVKDSSTVLPGHGGLLDRFDTMTVAAPLVYFYLAYVAGLIG